MTEPVSGRKPVSAVPIRRSASGRAIAKRRRVMRLLWAVFLVLPVFGARADVVFTTLYSFTNGSDGPMSPLTALVQGSDGDFYGTTTYGGMGGAGTVFRLTIVPEFQSVTLTNGTFSLTWSTEAEGV